jgi:hypothetical protein
VAKLLEALLVAAERSREERRREERAVWESGRGCRRSHSSNSRFSCYEHAERDRHPATTIAKIGVT